MDVYGCRCNVDYVYTGIMDGYGGCQWGDVMLINLYVGVVNLAGRMKTRVLLRNKKKNALKIKGK